MDLASLSDAQQSSLQRRFPQGLTPRADLSWGLVDTVVLHVHDGSTDLVVKAAGPGNRHIGREITGYETCPVWTDRGLGPGLVHADRDANLLVVTHVPGRLARDTPAESDPAVHRQAGAALASFHRQGARLDEEFEAVQRDHTLALLDRPHRIPPLHVDWLRSWLTAYDAPAVDLVPTHGDWSPRNWMVDSGGTLRVIDLGRFDWRPAASDVCRLAGREWSARPSLAREFAQGYGADLRDDPVWLAQMVREAVGTATWALAVGDGPFERHGLRLVSELVEAATA